MRGGTKGSPSGGAVEPLCGETERALGMPASAHKPLPLGEVARRSRDGEGEREVKAPSQSA